jgi:hypothetical protein
MYFDILLKDPQKAYIHDGQKGFLKQYTPQMSRQFESYESVFITSEPFEKPLVSCQEATKVIHPKKLLVAFNGSGFDNFISADVLMQKGYINKNRSLFFAGNKLFGLKFKSYETFDPYRFTFPSSLDACVRDFKLENKKLTDFKANFTTIQLMYQKGELFEWLKINHDPMYNYCRQDVLSLHELFFVLRDTFAACTHTFKNHGKYYDSFYTIAVLSKYAW